MAERASAARQATAAAADATAHGGSTAAAKKTSTTTRAKPVVQRTTSDEAVSNSAAEAGGRAQAAKSTRRGSKQGAGGPAVPRARTAQGGTTSTDTASRKRGKAAASSASRKEKAITRSAPAKRARPAADLEKIRVALTERRDALRAEYEQTIAELQTLQRDRLTDSAGDDQADTGTKTFEREQEISLANGILERINQVERALERVAEGNYGSCERCGNPILVERLAAFPSATLCISCKQLEERR